MKQALGQQSGLTVGSKSDSQSVQALDSQRGEALASLSEVVSCFQSKLPADLQVEKEMVK